jgi:hypothetical protein
VSDPGTERAWGWVAHLRDGGTTPWSQWTGFAAPAGSILPGAQQLELLRRINAVRRPRGELASRVLSTEPSRRDRPGLPLLGGPPESEFGPPPIDPSQVPAEELAQLSAVVLAGVLAAEQPPAPPMGRTRPWARRYHLQGDPELTRAVARHLVAHGRPPAAHGGRVLVVGTDAGRMLTDLWTFHALGEGVRPWPDWWRQRAGSQRLPATADLAHELEVGLRRPGVRGADIVTDPRLAPRLAGLRKPLPPAAPLAAAAVDLGRRVAGALRPLVGPETRRALVSEVLRPRLTTVTGPPLVVPARHRPWLEEQAARLVARLGTRHGRYPVHGDLELLLPADRPGTEQIRPGETVAAGIGLLLADAGRVDGPEEAP